MKNIFLVLAALFLCSSCSINRQIAKQAKPLLQDSAVNTGHMGICIYEPATGKYWYNYNSSHYFIPASNTKLFTLYAGMKYLGDSLVGMRFVKEENTTVIIPSGDPTFLLAEFKNQPVFDFLKQQAKIDIAAVPPVDYWGNGWAWNDYMDDYMAQRSVLPAYGNTMYAEWTQKDSIKVFPKYFEQHKQAGALFKKGIEIIKPFGDNSFSFADGNKKKQVVPFTPDLPTICRLLDDTLKLPGKTGMHNYIKSGIPIHSQPSDSLFKPMMHRSDNFFAEQTLLMASNEFLGYMNDEAIIDTLLKTSLKDVPQKPKWVDGSGLSRYNLFTPQDFVFILNKMKDAFGMERMKTILPTGGEGTISSYYKKEAGYIYGKTGTLSNNCAFSGYLFTQKGKLLIFSVLNNNYISGATPVRRAVERFLESIREKF